ncbi:BTAD domain-containing putative transcriptional regulator [Streptomyces sp. JNUCC 64]
MGTRADPGADHTMGTHADPGADQAVGTHAPPGTEPAMTADPAAGTEPAMSTDPPPGTAPAVGAEPAMGTDPAGGADPDPGPVRFEVLGEVLVRAPDGRVVPVPERKVRTLLGSLLAARLVEPGRPVAAFRLIDDLWGEEPPGNPRRALQAKVSQLRRALDEARPGGRELLAARAPGYQLVLEDGTVDADRFRALVGRARRVADPDARAALLGDALGTWRGPAFADVAEEPFARTAVQRLEEERLTAVEERAAARLAAGDHLALAAELAPLAAEHPTRERLVGVLVRALYRSGRQGEALAVYERLRHRLADDLGVDPSPGLVALHGAVLRQDPALSDPGPSDPGPSDPGLSDPALSARPAVPAPPFARAATAPRTNLFAPPGELVGRDGAVAEVAELLSGRRLVTLTGPGGVGKTRLALAVADRARAAFPDGVWLVELARDGDPADAVAAALGLRDDGVWGAQAPSGPVDKLAAALRGTRVLLVLDNCEHVVDETASLVEALLRRAPGLVVLATSRESLALAPETLWQVPPLDAAGGVELFAARAAASAPGFALATRAVGTARAVRTGSGRGGSWDTGSPGRATSPPPRRSPGPPWTVSGRSATAGARPPRSATGPPSGCCAGTSTGPAPTPSAGPGSSPRSVTTAGRCGRCTRGPPSRRSTGTTRGPARCWRRRSSPPAASDSPRSPPICSPDSAGSPCSPVTSPPPGPGTGRRCGRPPRWTSAPGRPTPGWGSVSVPAGRGAWTRPSGSCGRSWTGTARSGWRAPTRWSSRNWASSRSCAGTSGRRWPSSARDTGWR